MIPSHRLIKLLLLGFLPIILIGINELYLAIVLGYDLLLFCLCLLDITFSLKPGELEVERIHSKRLSLGQENRVRIRITNSSRYRAYLEVVDDHPPSFIHKGQPMKLPLDPLEQKEVSYSVRPDNRGDFRFGNINVRSITRLGLITRSFKIDISEEIKVYPNILGIKEYRSMATAHRLSQLGFHTFRRSGIGTEFESLREYQVDDEYKSINWKATSRVGYPITQLYETERSQNILIGLDASRMMAARIEGIAKLDYAINSALLIAFVAGRSDDRVGLFVFSHELEGFLPPRKGRAQFKTFLETLYKVEPSDTNVDYLSTFKFVAHKNKRRSLVIVYTDLLDEDTSAAFMKALPILSGSHLVMCVTLQDPLIDKMRELFPRTTADAYDKAAASMIRRDEEGILAKVKAGGALVLESPPDRLNVNLINKYIELKLHARI